MNYFISWSKESSRSSRLVSLPEGKSLKLKKKICSLKDTVKRIKRQAADRDKIFAKNRTDIGLLLKINKRFLKVNNETTTSLKNRPKTLTATSPKTLYRWQISI